MVSIAAADVERAVEPVSDLSADLKRGDTGCLARWDAGHATPQAPGTSNLLLAWVAVPFLKKQPPWKVSVWAIEEFQVDAQSFSDLFWQGIFGLALVNLFSMCCNFPVFISYIIQPRKGLENGLFSNGTLIFCSVVFLNHSFPWQTLYTKIISELISGQLVTISF